MYFIVTLLFVGRLLNEATTEAHGDIYSNLLLPMKIERKLRLSIPTPCDASAEHMTPTSCGSFCHLCRKEVVDFSAMTDTEILSVLRKSTSICGSFLPEQLDRDMVESYRVRRGFPFRLWAGILSFVAMLQLRPANAQVIHKETATLSPEATDVRYDDDSLTQHNIVEKDSTQPSLRGMMTGMVEAERTIQYIDVNTLQSNAKRPGFFRTTWWRIKGFFARIF